MNTSTQIHYRGYTIEEDYRNPYSNKPDYMYYPTSEGVNHDADCTDGESFTYCGNCKWASSIDEAKDDIWERVMLAIPQHKVVMNQREYYFDYIEDAIKFAVMFNAEGFIPACQS